MKKAKHLMYWLDIISGILLLVLQLRLTAGYFENYEDVEFLLLCRAAVSITLIMCIIITVVIRWICNDIKEEFVYLHTRISELEKKSE